MRNFPFYPFGTLLFGSSRSALQLMSKLWIVTWVKEGVFRNPQSSKFQLIVESCTKTGEKPKNYLFTSSPSLDTRFSGTVFRSRPSQECQRTWKGSMVDEGLRIRVTVVIFATGKTNISQCVGMLFQLRSLILVHHIIISCNLFCYM